ncbi:MAG: TolC family protein, partial [Parasphingorhabdus sp.]
MILSSRLVLAAATLAGALALGGCAPTLRPLPASAAVQPSLEWRTVLPATEKLEHSWWQRFGDARMVALVEKARKNNPDILLAAARVEEARATEAVSRSLLLPTIEAGVAGGARREVSPFGQGQNSLVAEPAFRASYEVDLFGKNRANIDAAQAGVAASEASEEAALLSVSAATASGYVSLLALDTRRKVL